eukprot:EG_transcript_33160
MATPSGASGEEEVAAVLKDVLDSTGVLDSVRAQIRAQVFKCLDQQWAAKPQLSTDNLLINELIRDYLEYNRYLHTADVLQHETGQPAERIPRPVLAAELKFQHTDQQLPLLYGILAYLRSDADTQP